MLALNDIATHDGEALNREERRRMRLPRLEAFLRTSFAPAIRDMAAGDLRILADFADRRAERHGITSLSGRLQFLVPVMLWGSYFDIDPRHRPALAAAGWTGPDRCPQRLLVEIDAERRACAADDDLQEQAQVLADLYRSKPAAPDEATMAHWMHALSARRTKAMDPQDRAELAAMVRRETEQLAMDPVDQVAIGAMSLPLGVGFWRDPRFPAIRRALKPDGRSIEERRLTFGRAVQAVCVAMASSKVPA